MYIEKIILEGFLSYRKRQEIDLSKISTCLVLGRLNNDPDLSNGAGKSSLFEAIPVNFFGKSSGRADVLDNYINDQMTKMYIELVFKIDGQRFKTVRTKTRNSSAVFEVFQDTTNEDLDRATWKKTDKPIEEILGLSSKTYSSTIYLNEREALQIITGSSSDRKEILRELLNIDIYEKASKHCNKNFDDFDKKVQVNFNLISDKERELEKQEIVEKHIEEVKELNEQLKTDIDSKDKILKDKLEEKKNIEVEIETEKLIKQQVDQEKKIINELSSSLEEINDEINSDLEQLEEQTKKYKALEKEVKTSIEIKEEIKEKIESKKQDLKVLDKVDIELKDLDRTLKNKTNEKSDFLSSIAVLRTELKPIEKFIEKVDEFESICPVTDLQCPVLKNDYKTEIKAEKEEEILVINKKIDVLNKNIEKVQKEILSLNEKEKQLKLKSSKRQIENEALSKLMLNLQTIENNEKRFKEKQEEFENYTKQTKEEIEKNKKKIEEINEKVEKKKKKLSQLEKKVNYDLQSKLNLIIENIDKIEKEKNILKTQKDKVLQQLGELKNQIEKFELLKSDIKVLQQNNVEYMNKKKTYQVLSKIFGKDGIQKAIMKESIPILEKYTTEFLKIFNDDSEKIKVKFDLDPRRQDGELKKGGGLEILVVEKDKEPKDLNMYSGGETVRIVFSIILSLAKLLSLRAGKKHEALIIDEKIAKLDSRGIEQFGEVISEISKIYKQVFIITHIESLKNLINGNEILVNKIENEGSLVSIS